MNRRRRRSTVAVMLLALLAVICLPVRLLHLQRAITDEDASTGNNHAITLLHPKDLSKDLSIPEDNDVLKLLKAFDDAGPLSAPVPRTEISPYTLDDVISVLPTFENVVGVVIYDPSADKFILHYSKHMTWIGGCHKLVSSFQALAHSLRSMFPERFTTDAAGNSPAELALALSSGDYPQVKIGKVGEVDWKTVRRNRNCYIERTKACVPSDIAPVLQFGSAFKSPASYPTMITMPMPQNNHVACFETYAASKQQKLCPMLLPRHRYISGNLQGLVFEETVGLGWDDLIPSVVWRGTDFTYLHKFYNRLRQPNFKVDIATKLRKIAGDVDVKVAATQAMRDVYYHLVPRWKSVIWTAEAEREAEEKQKELPEGSDEVIVPWANMKFAGVMDAGVKKSPSDLPYYQEFEEYGIPASGETMSLETLAQYKYHIDTGGGGGTTWSGTLEKLGLPGLLFHHETPMKDYLHDKMVKWVHYVPIKEDLSDLKEKFDWAESHPELAKQISDNATRLAKSLGTHEGFSIMFNEFYDAPLRAVIEAYQPLKLEGRDPGWLDVMVNNDLRPIMQCSGYYSHDCQGLVDDITFSRAAQVARDIERSERKK